MRSIFFVGIALCAVACAACGPSPAMQQRAQPKPPPNAVVVVVDCDDVDENEDEGESAATPAKKPVEYVHITEWQSPPAARDIEARIEPRGDKPADYVRLPNLTKHREIAPTTTYRTGRYWW